MSIGNLRLELVHRDVLARRAVEDWQAVLGVAGFERPPALPRAELPVTASMTPALGESAGLCEVWCVEPATGVRLRSARGTGGESGSADGALRFRHGAELAFGAVSVREEGDGAEALRQATAVAYRGVFEATAAAGCEHLVRIWNYVPDINGQVDGDERYRHFNAARQAAFRQAGHSTVGTVPAASALGAPPGSPLSIYFLASTRAPTMIENPRQTSAYHYPPKFGTHSPTFSRACMLPEGRGTTLFVSGTASIVGHETVHPGDVTAQTHETLANIDALLAEANRVAGTARYGLDALRFKVYVRRPADLQKIRQVLSTTLRTAVPVVYVQADVCRADLLVEIEATGETP